MTSGTSDNVWATSPRQSSRIIQASINYINRVKSLAAPGGRYFDIVLVVGECVETLPQLAFLISFSPSVPSGKYSAAVATLLMMLLFFPRSFERHPLS